MRNFIPTVFPLLPAEGGGGKATPVLFIKHQQNPGAEQASSQVYFYVCPPPPHRPLPPRPLLLVHMLSSCHEALHSKCQTWSYQKKLQNSKYVWIITPVKQRTASPPPSRFMSFAKLSASFIGHFTLSLLHIYGFAEENEAIVIRYPPVLSPWRL